MLLKKRQSQFLFNFLIINFQFYTNDLRIFHVAPGHSLPLLGRLSLYFPYKKKSTKAIYLQKIYLTRYLQTKKFIFLSLKPPPTPNFIFITYFSPPEHLNSKNHRIITDGCVTLINRRLFFIFFQNLLPEKTFQLVKIILIKTCQCKNEPNPVNKKKKNKRL